MYEYYHGWVAERLDHQCQHSQAPAWCVEVVLAAMMYMEHCWYFYRSSVHLVQHSSQSRDQGGRR